MNIADIFKVENLPPVYPMDSPEGQGEFTVGQSMTSGNFAIDEASGIWGFPKDRIIEIFGEESAGKTTIALQCLAACNQRGLKGAIVDVEHALDWVYAQDLGVIPRLTYLRQPDSAEEALKLTMAFCQADDISVCILDSVAGLITEQELNGDVGDANIAAVARLMSANVKKIAAICSVNDTLCIMINQNRSNPGAYGAIYQTGGRSLKFYASMRINLRRVTTNKVGTVSVSNETEVSFRKNKLASPYTTGTFDLVFGKGADNGKAIIKSAVRHGILEKKGGWIAYNGEQIGQGAKGSAVVINDNNTLREEIIGKIKEAVAAKKGQAPVDKVKKKASIVAPVSSTLKINGFIKARNMSLVSPLDDE